MSTRRDREDKKGSRPEESEHTAPAFGADGLIPEERLPDEGFPFVTENAPPRVSGSSIDKKAKREETRSTPEGHHSVGGTLGRPPSSLAEHGGDGPDILMTKIIRKADPMKKKGRADAKASRSSIGTFVESIKTGVKDIYYHKMRSVLTMVGIMLGVASLIMMTSIMKGLEQKTFDIMNETGGLNKITISYAAPDPDEEELDSFKPRKLLLADAQHLMEKHSEIISNVSPTLRTRAHMKYAGKDVYIGHRLQGITSSFYEVNKYDVALGRKFGDYDDYGLSRVCIIGSIIKQELFGDNNPIDKKIVIGESSFRVVGVFSNYRMTSPLGGGRGGMSLTRRRTRDTKKQIKMPEYAIKETKGQASSGRGWRRWRAYAMDNAIWYKNLVVVMPYSTMNVLFKKEEAVDSIDILLKNADNLPQKISTIRRALEQNGLKSFNVEDMSAQFQATQQQMMMFNIVFGVIAAISLIVGGIGIMNVILASINERIREIGVRKSVGAADSDIFIQFLVETAILALLGGGIGVPVSFAVAKYVEHSYGLPAVISIDVITLAVGFSGFIGLVFGLYPSIKASRLNPISALRYE